MAFKPKRVEVLTNPIYKVVAFAVDLTGNKLIDEICHISASEGNTATEFDQYIMTYRDISSSSVRTHGIRIFTMRGKCRVMKDMNNMRSIHTKSEYSTLNDFMKWLTERKGNSAGVILAYHDNGMDKIIPFILEALKRYQLTDEFFNIVKGFVNCCSIISKHPDVKGKSLALRSLARRLLRETAKEDVVTEKETFTELDKIVENGDEIQKTKDVNPTDVKEDAIKKDVIETEKPAGDEEPKKCQDRERRRYRKGSSRDKSRPRDKERESFITMQSSQFRAMTTYKLFHKFSPLASEPTIFEDELLKHLSTRDEELKTTQKQRELAAKVRSLRPIFLGKIRTSPKDRRRAVLLRRYLIEAALDYTTLKEAYDTGSTEAVRKIVEETAAKKKKPHLDELIQLIVNHFETTTKKNLNANDRKSGGADDGRAGADVVQDHAQADQDGSSTGTELTEESVATDGTFPIFVKTMAGHTITVIVHQRTKISTLMSKLVEEVQIPDDSRLLFKSVQLARQTTIQQNQIKRESTLLLLLRLRGGMEQGNDLPAGCSNPPESSKVICAGSIARRLKKPFTTPEHVLLSSSEDEEIPGTSNANTSGRLQVEAETESDDDDFKSGTSKGLRISTAPKSGIKISPSNQKQRVPTPKLPNLNKCTQCSYTTQRKSNLDRHLKTHDSSTKTRTIQCPDNTCRLLFTRLANLDIHLMSSHKIQLQTEVRTFESKPNFTLFRENLQAKHSTVYIRKRFTGSSNNPTSETWNCNRSGCFVPQTKKRLRTMKKAGSIKIGRVCPSRLEVKYSENQIKVTHFKTHFGHTIDPGRVGLTPTQKRTIAHKRLEGVPIPRIIDDIRNEIGGPFVRLALTNTQDIINIDRKFGIACDVRLHSNDAVSVEATVNLLKQKGNSILIYKRQGELDSNFPTLKKDDFMLGFMNAGQEQMLRNHGSNIICIDSTHGTNAYNFEMTTLVVLDPSCQAFPVAFFFHSSKTEETYALFFQQIKNRFDGIAIQPRVFMSDDEVAFYNAWKKVMGDVEHKLLCAWHVLRNWHKAISKLEPKNRKQYYDQLRDILQENDIPTFEKAFTTFLESIKSSELHTYLTKHYASRKEQWAYCYRVHKGINTNMYLEAIHKQIKYNYMHGKRTKRLDVGFAAVRRFLRDLQVKRLISVSRQTLNTKDIKLHAAHSKSEEASTELVRFFDNRWFVTSLQNRSTLPYIVVRLFNVCPFENECQISCQPCGACFHEYQCSCKESANRTNMCKHIHLVCRYQSENQEKFVEAAEDFDDDERDLCIDTNSFKEQLHQEKQAHMLDLATSIVSVDNEISKMRQDVELAFSLLTDAPSREHCRETLSRLVSSLKALQIESTPQFEMTSTAKSEPSNKKIEPQRKFKSVKKPSVSKKVSRRVNIQESQIPLPGTLTFYSADQ